MIEQLHGTLLAHHTHSITVLVQGIGFHVQVAHPSAWQGERLVVYTHVHWNQDRGMTCYGFATPFERSVFLLLLDCPSIGPSIALSLLRQAGALQLVKALTLQDSALLSSYQGIGKKKAEQMIVSLKEKALTLKGGTKEEGGAFQQLWQESSSALESLGYSRQEIATIYPDVYEVYKDTTPPPAHDQILRKALQLLSTLKK